MYTDFKDKEIYKKAKELYALISGAINEKVPYSLKDQICRSAMSVILNFAEGYGRYHKRDKKNFYLISRDH